MSLLVPQGALTIPSILKHAESIFHDKEVISIDTNGNTIRSTYAQVAVRCRKLANALQRLNVGQGDTVSTFAWNDQRHLESYFAIPGLGAICHTVNPRLYIDQIQYILNDAKSKWLFVDPQFIPMLLPILDSLSGLNGIVVLGSADSLEEIDTAAHKNLAWHDYESLIQNEAETITWPEFDENTPSSCCYTSGTTGNPKGVLYSHRSTVIHSLALSLPDAASLSSGDNLLVVVPMFHVNGWSLPYAAAMTGAKLVLPGRFMGDGKKLAEIIKQENVNAAAGVPTVWQSWVNHMQQQETDPNFSMRVLIGGAACSEKLRSALEDQGCHVRLAWGMTETSPMGTINRGDNHDHTLSPGTPVFGVELRIVDESGSQLPHDGKACGELQIKGPWVVRGYIGQDNPDEFSEDGWFSTGDVANIHPDGYMHITDRAKDVIKSGGEWISSSILEEIASSHPNVVSAAVIATPHPKWDERPLLLVVPQNKEDFNADQLLQWFDGKVAKWWKPDGVKLIESLPLTATGKVDKKALRSEYA